MRAALIVFVLWSLSCTPTQTVVRFEAGPGVQARASAVRVRLYRLPADELFYDETISLGGDLPERQVPVSPRDDDASRRFRAEATLFERGQPFASAAVEAGFRSGEQREVWIVFDDVCVDVECPPARTCLNGLCQPLCVGPSDDPRDRVDCGSTPPPDVGPPDPVDMGANDQGADDGGAPCDCPCGGDVCTPDGNCAPSVALRALDVGARHSCAIDTENRLWCWGDNREGQLVGSEIVVTEPTLVPVADGTAVVDFAVGGTREAGTGFTAVIVQGSALYTWGASPNGRLGRTGDPRQPGQVEGSWSSVDLGGGHGCGTKGDAMWCWGAGDSRQTQREGDTTEPVQTTATIIGLSLGKDHTCAWSRTTGACMGAHEREQLARPDPADATVAERQRLAPVPAPTPDDRPGADTFRYTMISAGAEHTCALGVSGSSGPTWLYCAGAGAEVDFRLGLDVTLDVNFPDRSLAQLDVDWRSVSAGWTHTCGIDSADTLRCWGDALLGGEPIASDLPASATVPGSYQAVSAGNRQTCAIDIDGRLFCWGESPLGNLGLGSVARAATPTRVCFSDD